MSKFEEYDLYARNKDFLISDAVITFTDTNGRLMALKPDVTLSIVKNTADMPGSVQKLFYNENVYRVSKGANSFREITQMGLECMGAIDEYTIYETLYLAAKSLKCISDRAVLDISDLGIFTRLLDDCGVPEDIRPKVLKCAGEKNLHELSEVLMSAGLDTAKADVIKQLITVSGPAADVVGEVTELLTGRVDETTLTRFTAVMNSLIASDVRDMLNIDFSVVDDVHYYNGFVFKGFIDTIPSAVLSGGQYDKLMQKMGRKSGAIGFAVYTDALDMLETDAEQYDVDVVILYDENTPVSAVQKWVRTFMNAGSGVMAQPSMPENIRCKQVVRLKNGEVEIVEDDA